jgi:hypothetical protein
MVKESKQLQVDINDGMIKLLNEQLLMIKKLEKRVKELEDQVNLLIK